MLDRLAYLRKEAAQMTRIILVALGLVLFLTNYSSAQSYCAQVKQAVATYGYSSAKRYARAHYSKQAVRAADRCLRRR